MGVVRYEFVCVRDESESERRTLVRVNGALSVRHVCGRGDGKEEHVLKMRSWPRSFSFSFRARFATACDSAMRARHGGAGSDGGGGVTKRAGNDEIDNNGTVCARREIVTHTQTQDQIPSHEMRPDEQECVKMQEGSQDQGGGRDGEG